jgi:hypothetical protein
MTFSSNSLERILSSLTIFDTYTISPCRWSITICLARLCATCAEELMLYVHRELVLSYQSILCTMFRRC